MIKNILFDFDGVILDSMPIRDYGFREILKGFPKETVEKLIEYHRENGGLSRFVKIRYFFEEILKTKITEEEVEQFAYNFSKIMKKELINKKYLISDSVDFIKKNYKKFNINIVSGSEEKELNYLCENLGIKDFFITIKGSPIPKTELVKNIIEKYNYKKEETILIGDSINDYNAAKENGIKFYGYNNNSLKKKSEYYIKYFSSVENPNNL